MTCQLEREIHIHHGFHSGNTCCLGVEKFSTTMAIGIVAELKEAAVLMGVPKHQ